MNDIDVVSTKREASLASISLGLLALAVLSVLLVCIPAIVAAAYKAAF